MPAKSYLKTKTRHTRFVLVDSALALLLRVWRVGKQHALIPLRLLILADTARLGVAC
jgi:hypothetical protein